MLRVRLLVAPLWPVLGWLVACLSLFSVTSDARAAGAQARLRFHAVPSAAGGWTISDRPEILAGADPAFARNLDAILAPFPVGSVNAAAFSLWLAQAYWQQFGVFPATRSRAPGAENTWTITVPQAPTLAKKLHVKIPSTAVPGNQTPPPISWRAPAIATANATTKTLWANTTIELVPTGPPGTPASPNAPAFSTLADLVTKIAAQIAVRYGENQNTYRDAAYKDMQQLARVSLGPPYQLSLRTEPVSADTLTVEILGLNPIVAYTASIDRIELPGDEGNHPTRTELVEQYGDTPLTRRLIAQMDSLQLNLQDALDTRRRPEFVNAQDRGRLVAALQETPAFRHLDGANPSTTSTATVLDVPASYKPASGTLVAALSGDSVRTLRGSTTFTYEPMWRPHDKITASFAPGTDGIGAGAHYGFPFRSLGPAAVALNLDAGGDYHLTRDNRLGTRSGPLVSLEDTSAGFTLTLARSWPARSSGALAVHNAVSIKFRDLRSTGTLAFLGGIERVHGTIVANTLAANMLTADTGKGHWAAGGQLQSSVWLTNEAHNLYSTEATAYARRTFADANGPSFYFQLRGAAGTHSPRTPRMAFYLLGGDTWLRGLQSGEIAGRNYEAAGIDAGPSVAWLWRHVLPSSAGSIPSTLCNVYLEGLAEVAAVAGKAGTNFNPTSRAQSYGLAVFGPGLISGGSITAGYAWSAEALRPHGRFFVSMSVLFQR